MYGVVGIVPRLFSMFFGKEQQELHVLELKERLDKVRFDSMRVLLIFCTRITETVPLNLVHVKNPLT